ncbi:MAG: hypothetical protein NTW21_21485 [Verrucomicrobia bacterium]|nr:hypothetical protein [Verrucomicrobiota bacterium]
MNSLEACMEKGHHCRPVGNAPSRLLMPPILALLVEQVQLGFNATGIRSHVSTDGGKLPRGPKVSGPRIHWFKVDAMHQADCHQLKSIRSWLAQKDLRSGGSESGSTFVFVKRAHAQLKTERLHLFPTVFARHWSIAQLWIFVVKSLGA